MKKTGIFAAAILTAILSTTSLADEPQVLQEIRANCAAEWADDFVMQDYCIKQQVEALITFNEDFYDLARENAVIGGIVGRCAVEWPGKVAGFDYVMVLYCVQQQVEAYNRLQGG